MRTWRSHKHDNKSPAGRHGDVSKDVSGFRSNSVSLCFFRQCRYFFRTHILLLLLLLWVWANHVSQFPPCTRSHHGLFYYLCLFTHTQFFTLSVLSIFIMSHIAHGAIFLTSSHIEPLHKLLTCELTRRLVCARLDEKFILKFHFSFPLNLFSPPHPAISAPAHTRIVFPSFSCQGATMDSCTFGSLAVMSFHAITHWACGSMVEMTPRWHW